MVNNYVVFDSGFGTTLANNFTIAGGSVSIGGSSMTGYTDNGVAGTPSFSAQAFWTSPINYANIRNTCQKLAGNAGTAAVWQCLPTVAANAVINFTIVQNGKTYFIDYTCAASGATTASVVADLVTLFSKLSAIQVTASSIVSGAATWLVLTAKTGSEIFTPNAPSAEGWTFYNSTVGVARAGVGADLTTNSNVACTSTNVYDAYVINYADLKQSANPDNILGLAKQLTVYVNQGASNYANFTNFFKYVLKATTDNTTFSPEFVSKQ